MNRVIAKARSFRARAHYQRANALKDAGQFEAARASYDRAIELFPDYAFALCNRGTVLAALGAFDAALASYDRAIAADPGDVLTWFNRAIALQALRQPQAALESYDRALALRPDYADALCNRGVLLAELGRHTDALVSYDRAIAADPASARSWFNRGAALAGMCRLDEALASYERAIELQPDLADAWHNKSLTLLLQGDFERGWPLYEWRWRNPRNSGLGVSRNYPGSRWLGEQSLDGRRILLHWEQGLGDTLQFCRYAKVLADRGAEVLLEVQAPLVRLLAGLPGAAQVFATGGALPDFDYHCALLSLPLACRTTLQSIPATVPYLYVDADKSATWQVRLGERRRPRIGLVCSGGTLHRNDHNRSVALGAWVPHLPREFDYVCLQKEFRDADRHTLDENPWIAQHAAALADFSDTAALTAEMDLVISVDTSVAHLAGALGKRTWLLLPSCPDWRWLLARDDSPWYPTMRLFRQHQAGDWHDVFIRVAAELGRELPQTH